MVGYVYFIVANRKIYKPQQNIFDKIAHVEMIFRVLHCLSQDLLVYKRINMFFLISSFRSHSLPVDCDSEEFS